MSALVSRLADLVAINSVNASLAGGPGEQAMADYVSQVARGMGADVEQHEVEPGRPNVLARTRPRTPPHADVRVSPGHGWAGADARRAESAHRGRAALRTRLRRSEGIAGRHAERDGERGGGRGVSSQCLAGRVHGRRDHHARVAGAGRAPARRGRGDRGRADQLAAHRGAQGRAALARAHRRRGGAQRDAGARPQRHFRHADCDRRAARRNRARPGAVVASAPGRRDLERGRDRGRRGGERGAGRLPDRLRPAAAAR